MKNKIAKKGMVVYQAKSGALELRGDFSRETIWATQAQIVKLFNIDQSVASRHINNILKQGEVDAKSNMQKMHIANSDKPVVFYSLDLILAVGYRANSARAIEFRKWATEVLRSHITDGFTINKSRIKDNYDHFLKSVSDIQSLLPEHVTLDPKTILELVKDFASTWISLDAYDKSILKPIGTTKKTIKLTGQELTEAISQFRTELIRKKEATDICAQERAKGNIEGIVGNVMQSFAGQNVYKTAEEKAANLLYFMVKNHPFVDGNKRSGAFAFIWFIRKINIRGQKNINPASLTAFTLLIAESDPKRKDQMVALVTQFLR